MAKAVDTLRKKENLRNYRYLATTGQGKPVKGTIKATSEIAAERLLIAMGRNPLQVEVAPSMFSLEEALPSLFRVKPRDVITFSRQLATLLRSGISLLPALEILHGQVGSSRAFRGIILGIVNDIRAGSSFSQSIAKHPRAFNDIYARTIAVGEESGGLENVLKQMADFLERQSSTSQGLRKALTYPIIVLGVGSLVVVLLVTMVMPKLLGMFTALNVGLPLPTRILIGLTKFLEGNQLPLLIAASSVGAVVLWMTKQPRGRRLLDRLRLTAPIIGPPVLMSEMGRFARSVSVLVASGVQLQEIMELLPQSTNNVVFRDALKRINEGFLLGEGLSEPMSRTNLFPPLMVQMVAVGEESNTLDFTMGVCADFYESTAGEKMNAMVGMIGPLSTIGIALLVGFIALAVIMPMYSLTGAFG
ncbi:MAG: type II secretion system F family protein [Chloroflexi bacterium]|nr:type II secretion system F family protein [Chloroflexota bacterium]